MKSDGLCNDSDIEAAGMNRFEQLHNLFVYCPASNITTRIVLWRVETVCFLCKNGLSGSWKKKRVLKIEEYGRDKQNHASSEYY